MALKKKYLLGKEARAKLLEGAKIVYDLVAHTSGPKGRNTAYSRPWGLPRIINDGIEIAKEVGSEDDFANVGIDLIREAAQNTVTDAGDGTTTSIILAYTILLEAIARIDQGANPMVIRKEILDSVDSLLKEIPNLSTKITTQDELKKVALISSSGDEEIAEAVSKTVHEMGVDGIVTAEEGNMLNITAEVTKGMQLQKGYLDARLVTDDMRMEAVVVDPAIIIFDKVVTHGQLELAPIMNEVAKINKNIVIFGDIRGDALATIVLNKVRGTVNVLAVNPPGYQEQRLAMLQDIAALTGAQIITNETQNFHHSHAGKASHVTANKTTTTIAGGKGQREVIEARIGELKEKLTGGNNTLYEREKFEERLSKLAAGVAVIKVGSKTETSKREKFEKTKDAIGACKAALAEGIVTGGGMTFMQLANTLNGSARLLSEGEMILVRALLAPTEKILANSGKGKSDIEEIMPKLIEASKRQATYGYNVNSDKIEDMMIAGVVDPTRVIRLSLENAAVVATSMFTVEGLVVDVPPENQLGQQ